MQPLNLRIPSGNTGIDAPVNPPSQESWRCLERYIAREVYYLLRNLRRAVRQVAPAA